MTEMKYIMLTIAIITAVVGFVLLDDMLAPMIYPQTVTGEVVNTTTATPVNLAYDDLVDNSWTVKNASSELTETTDYTITRATGVFTLVNGDYNSTALTVDYQYYETEYMSSSLSRIILQYIVPLGLLGALVLVVVF
ncbi:MAG TPA: hypothetical protein PLG47_03555 [Candidatus Dojkabacteria bacterium]|nr:hypothetical protein [Candidatus Dojkabacteria bacterium]